MNRRRNARVGRPTLLPKTFWNQSSFGAAAVALLALPCASTAASAASLSATVPLIPAWYSTDYSQSYSGSPVTLTIDFDAAATGSQIFGTGTVSAGGATQAGVSASLSFTTFAGSGSANGNVLSFTVVLDDQPYEDQSFYVNGKYYPAFVDVHPDSLPFNVDLNAFSVNFYGSYPGSPFGSLAFGDALTQFFATNPLAGQRVVYYPNPFQSQIWGPQNEAPQVQLTLGDTGTTAAVPLPAGLPLLATALAALGLLRRRTG